jgi:hypothetical protein
VASSGTKCAPRRTQAGRHVAIYWDGTNRLEVGTELRGPFAEQGDVVRSATPRGVIATITHFGDYSGPRPCARSGSRLVQAGHHSLAGPNWEIYGHWQRGWKGNPSQNTDVFYQLAQA